MAEAQPDAAEEASRGQVAFPGHDRPRTAHAAQCRCRLLRDDDISGIGGELSQTTHREYAGLIHQSGKHLLEVVAHAARHVSRSKRARFELQTEPFHAPRTWSSACLSTWCETLAQKRGRCTLVSDIEPEPAQCWWRTSAPAGRSCSTCSPTPSSSAIEGGTCDGVGEAAGTERSTSRSATTASAWRPNRCSASANPSSRLRTG
jgi:hypothetical protein